MLRAPIRIAARVPVLLPVPSLRRLIVMSASTPTPPAAAAASPAASPAASGGRGRRRGGNGGGDGRDAETTRQSKKLSWALRHGGVEAGLVFRPDGYTRVDALLARRDLFPGLTLEALTSIVASCPKQRFKLWTDDSTGVLYVRANQGHSFGEGVISEEGLLTLVTDAAVSGGGEGRSEVLQRSNWDGGWLACCARAGGRRCACTVIVIVVVAIAAAAAALLVPPIVICCRCCCRRRPWRCTAPTTPTGH